MTRRNGRAEEGQRMSETDIADGGAVAETAARTSPRAPLPARCYACGTEALGPYCHACGQKNDDCRRSIWRLGTEAVRDLTSLDGRFARTIRSVATRPGRHLRAYSNGVRSPFTPPVRLFLVALFVFFATLELTDRQILVLHPKVEMTDGAPEFGGGTIGFLQPTPERYTEEEREALRRSIAGDLTRERSAADEAREEAPPEADEAVADGPGVGLLETGDGGAITLNGRTISRGRLADGLVRAAENPRAINNALHDWTLRTLLVLVPLLALLGALFVRGRDALLYDHLLLSLQTHAVAFGVLTLGLWLVWLVPVSWTGAVFMLGVPIYHAVAMRGAFGRRRRKVVAATLFAFALYWLVALILLGIAVFSAFEATL